jgi:hypothetical protein
MNKTRLSRRHFLRNSSYGLIAAGVLSKREKLISDYEVADPETISIREYRTL